MIHTAEYHVRKVYNEDELDDSLQLAITLNPHLELIIKAINEARIEAIKECSELSKDKPLHSLITKQSILKLLNDIK